MRLSAFEPIEDGPGYVLAVVVTAMATGINFVLSHHIAITNLAMVYLLAVSYVASRCNPGPAVLASLLGVAVFDFTFVPPSGTFAVSDVQYLFTFGVMLVVSLLISTLTVQLRDQSRARSNAALNVRVEKARGDLLSAVSHDLRTPLSSIEGSASVLVKQPELSDESRQLAATIQEESGRMGRLIRNLLDMTRVQGVIDLELDWYAMDELMANAILRTEGMLECPVQLTVGDDTPLAQVDGVLMEQVFVNLLENAVRHAGSQARVEVEIRQKDRVLQVSFRDDGPGVPTGAEERIFERFQGTKGAGTGLGLAICRAAVEAHGGCIRARNRPSRGLEFILEIPLPAEESHG